MKSVCANVFIAGVDEDGVAVRGMRDVKYRLSGTSNWLARVEKWWRSA